MSAVPQRTGFVRALPDSNEYVRLLSKDDTVGLRSGLQTLQPGQDCGWHTTENYEEMIICLAGAGELAAEDGTRRPLAAGHYAYNPPQTRHNVFNTGTEPLRYIYVVAPVAAAAGDHR
jgi:quercetin dioxygenase-like cupin family protein